MVIDNLYFGEGGHHGEFVNASFEFNTDVLSTFLRRIYNGFDTSKDFEPTMWREILRVINEATVEGLTHSSYDISQEEEFLKSLAHSNEVFSAFKVHAMGVDMAKKLVGENGKLKPFEQWKKDVAPIASHYCGSWLQTEYNTAVLRGHFAAEWKQYVADADIFPNLRWMPTTSATPDEEHKVYWMNRLTLPVSHPFWETHHPGDHWNCKCSLEQTDEAANPDVLGDVPEVKAQPGLKANPGITGEIFDETHPYIEDTPKDEKKSVKKDIQREKDREKAVEWYVSGDGMWVNQYLRGRGNFGSLSKDEEKLLKDLTEATHKDIVGTKKTFRAINADALFKGGLSDYEWELLESSYFYPESMDKKSKSMVEKIKERMLTDYQDKGFMSTTKDKEIALDWGDFSGAEHPVVIEIELDETTKGLDLGLDMPSLEKQMEQDEIILECGQSMKISMSIDVDSGVLVFKGKMNPYKRK